MKKIPSMQDMEQLLEAWGAQERKRREKLITAESQARLDAELSFHLRVIRENRWDLLEARSRAFHEKYGIPYRTVEETLALTDDRPKVSWNIMIQGIVERAHETFAILFRHPAFASVALSLFIVFGGSFVALHKAKGSLPGESLYTVKLAFEEAKVSLAWDEEAKAKLELVRVKERAREVNIVALRESESLEQKKQRVAVAVEHLKKGLSNVEGHVKALEEKGEKEKVFSVALATEEHGKEAVILLANTEVQLPKDVNGEVRDELREALSGVNAERTYALTFLREGDRGGSGEATTSEPVISEPVTGESVISEPVTGESVISEPVTGDQVKSESVTQENTQEVKPKPIKQRTVEISPGINVFTNFAPSVFSDPLSNPAPNVFTEKREFTYSVFSDPNLSVE